MMNEEYSATVICFNNAGHYGFIRDNTGHDLFVHASQIISPGYKTLIPGEMVDYRLMAGERGWQACDVRRHGH